MQLLSVAVSLSLAVVLIRLAWIDLHSFRLPDIYTVPLIAAGLALSEIEGGVGLLQSTLGGAIGFGLFWLIGYLHYQRRGVEGLGLGDAKLFAASGTWLGVAMLPHVLLVASLGGLLFAALRRGHASGSHDGDQSGSGRIAFGPWLALGFFAIWVGRGLGWIG